MQGARTDGESSRYPWEHDGARVEGGRLLVAGRDAEALARELGTPLYAIDVTRVAEQARALRDALARAGLTPRVRLALKAQRAPEVPAALLALGGPGLPGAVGVDVCSRDPRPRIGRRLHPRHVDGPLHAAPSDDAVLQRADLSSRRRLSG